MAVRLFDGEVWDAQRVGEGGVVFRHEERSGVAVSRVRSGSSEVEPVPIESSGFANGFLVVDGRLTAVVEREIGTQGCPGFAALFLDVASGRESVFTCGLPLEDGSLRPESHGGGLLLGALDVSSGATGTSVGFVFWDREGGRVELAANPFPAVFPGCAPCRVEGRLAPDGATLAYLHRPDAKWPTAMWDGRSDDEWWELSRVVEAELVVVELESGRELFREPSPAGSQLTDYDGRHLSVAMPPATRDEALRSVVFDTTGAVPAVEVPGLVRFADA